MGKDLKGKELGKNISQEKTGYYVARFVDRYGKRQSKRFKKLQECRQWLADAMFINEHSDMSMPYDLTVDAWYEQWIDLKKREVRDTTLERYITTYNNHIKPALGNMLIRNVKPIHCQHILNQLADDDRKTSTINSVRMIMSHLFQKAFENDIILSNPCRKAVNSNIGKASDERHCLTIAEQKLFLESIVGHEYENQFKLVLQTGLRAGEMIGLKWEDINFSKRVLSVRRTAVYSYKSHTWKYHLPKSAQGTRTIPLTSEAIRILKDQKKKMNKNKTISLEWADTIFLNDCGEPEPTDNYNKAILKINKEYPLPEFSMHILRHTFATRCIENGMKPKTLQIILGHAQLSTTMDLYVHVTDDEMTKEMDKVEDWLCLKAMSH